MSQKEPVQSEAKDRIKEAFGKWLERLGLLWWDVTIRYYDDPGEIITRFRDTGSDTWVAAITTADWRYAEATVDVNVSAFDDFTPEAIERVVVHELMHILINEMREEDLHHEERVVTGLTKAIFWTARAVERECEKPS